MISGDKEPAFGSSLPEVRVTPPGPLSLEMARRLTAVESRNVTHLTPSFPVFWSAAVGANVQDVDGNVFLDLTGAFGVSIGGHGHPHVVARMREQAGTLIHGMGDVHPPSKKVEFLEKLGRMAPWPECRAILGSSGAEAVEAALKTAEVATGKSGILAFEGAYHGLTLGALAVTSRGVFRTLFERRLFSGVAFAPFPDPLRQGERAGSTSLEVVERILEEGAGGYPVGAVIVEPIQGRAGVQIPPPGFLQALARLTRAAGALLIFDEIFTGLGRCGARFACLQEGVLPDLLCLGKGLGGGLPLSACLGPPAVMDAWPASEGEAIHTSTFLGHPLACASGLAILELLESGKLVERSAALGETLLAGLREGLADIPQVGEVRGKGLFVGVELVERGSLKPLEKAAVRVAEVALRRGILLLPAGARGNVVELSPPLVLAEGQLAWVVPQLVEVIRGAVG